MTQETRDEVTVVVLDAFADVIGDPAPRGAETVPDDVEGWTSLTHVHLVFEVESRLGVSLPAAVLIHGGPLSDLVAAARAGTA